MKSLTYLSFLMIFLPQTSGQSSTKSEFFIAFPKSTFTNEALRIFITTQHEETTTVLINSMRNYAVLTFIQPGFTREINPPSSFEILSKLDHNKGIWILPTNPMRKISVSVMKHARASTLSGNYLALPPIMYQNLHEYEYFVTSYFWNNRIPNNYNSTVVLVGCKANTSVTITPSQRVEVPPHFLTQSYPQGWLNAGESYTVMLQPMETLHIESLHDLTATRIMSNKPLTVLGSHECADVPAGVEFCDYLVEQFPPTVTWGRLFLFASANSRRTGEHYKVIALKSLTSVKVKCVTEGESSPDLGHITVLINASGENREFALGANRSCSMVADKPILLVQYALGYSLDNVGDPFMLMIPPVKQYSNNYTVTAPTSYYNHLTITVSMEHYGSNKILLNGTIVNGWSPVYCSDTDICGYVTRPSVPPGTHRVRHVDAHGKFMVYVYGFEYHDGYGQIAGMKLEWIADVCEHGALRLDPSPLSFSDDTTSAGAVEMCVEGVWTSMCSNVLGTLEAAVACTQLGFSEFGSVMDGVNSTGPNWPTMASDVRCLGSEQVLMDCIRHRAWGGAADCYTGRLASIKCYPHYDITVDILASELHFAHTLATLVCHITLNTTLHADQTMYLVWSKDTTHLTNSTQHTISETTLVQSSETDAVHFESKLTVHNVKPDDNGTYICSAAVVSTSNGQPLSGLASTSVVIGVVESEYQLFQIRLLGVGRCVHWLLQSPLEKIAQIKAAITEHVQSRCPNCGLTDAHFITGAVFRCFSETANEITLRARLHDTSQEANITELVGYLQEWVSTGPLLPVSGMLLRIDQHCEVMIESLEAEECVYVGASVSTTTAAIVTSEDGSISTDLSTTSGSPYTTTGHLTGSHEPTQGTTMAETVSPQLHNTTSPLQDQHFTTTATSGDEEPTVGREEPTTSREEPTVGREEPTTSQESTSPTGSGRDRPHTQDMVIFVGVGGAVFVLTVLVISVVCMVVIINCLKYRKPPSCDHVISATSPFPLPLYDDPISDNLQMKCPSPEKFLESDTI